MDDIFRGIGCFVIAVLFLAIPVLCGISFILWSPFVSFILTMTTLLEIIWITIDLYYDGI